MSAYSILINRSIEHFFKDALKISLRNPASVYFSCRTIIWQKKAARLRSFWEDQGVPVPPMMIASITNKCNLKCKGCYAHAHKRPFASEMTIDRWFCVMKEAQELGISIIFLAGGEPLIRKDMLTIIGKFPEIIFLLFTNGLLLNEEIITEIKKQRHLIPVISLEGFDQHTDWRRGEGVYGVVQKTIKNIKKSGKFFGVSLTLTRENFIVATSEQFIKTLIAAGCSLFFFVEYISVEAGTEDLVLTKGQQQQLENIRMIFRSKFHRLFVVFPGNEKQLGGCLSAGRGFIHISPEGGLEPCPFAPYSDTNVKDVSLKEALQSRLLSTIRQNSEEFNKTTSGCVLREQRDWLRSETAIKF